MGFFDFLKKSAAPAAPAAPAFPLVLAADAKGAVVPMEQIPDEVFAQGILGQCCGIDPTEGKVYAPIDGEITQRPRTGHPGHRRCRGADPRRRGYRRDEGRRLQPQGQGGR